MLRNLVIISIAWSVVILILSGLPGDSLPETKVALIPHFDKLVHMGMYFPLAFFLIAEFDLSRKQGLVKWAAVLTLMIVGVYGGIIEMAQDFIFVHRSADAIDFLFDMLGGVLGLLCYYILFRKAFRRWARND